MKIEKALSRIRRVDSKMYLTILVIKLTATGEPAKDPKATSDPYKTLFVSRLVI